MKIKHNFLFGLLLFVSPFLLFSQENPNPMEFGGEFHALGNSKKQMFDNALRWVKVTYKNPEKVLTKVDKENYTIEAKAGMIFKPQRNQTSNKAEGYIWYKFEYKSINDSTYAFRCYDFYHESRFGKEGHNFDKLTYHEFCPIKVTSDIQYNQDLWGDIKTQAFNKVFPLLSLLRADVDRYFEIFEQAPE